MPQPDGSLLYELLTSHPDRLPQDLVFLADLTCELRGLADRHLGQPRRQPAGHRRSSARRLAQRPAQGPAAWRLTAEEVLELERPAMTYLRQHLARQVGRAFRRWLHPSSGRRPGDRFL